MKRNWKRIISLTMCLLLTVATLAACSGENAGMEAEGNGNAASEAENTLIFALSEDIQTLDAASTSNVTGWTVLPLIFDQPIYDNYDGTYAPGLFEKWEANEDSSAWSIKLREGVKFHNGEEFNAESVVVTITRMATDSTLSAVYPTWSILEEVEVVDDYNVVLKFTQPWAAFPAGLTRNVNFVAPKAFEELGTEKYFANPVGCGPFTFDSWQPGGDMVLKRNTEWWGKIDGESNVDTFIFRYIAEDTTRVAALRTGEIDVIRDIPAELLETVSSTEGVVVDISPSTTVCWSGFECGEGYIFNDINTRKAVWHAIDRQLICDSILGGGFAWQWLVPEGVRGYDAENAWNEAGYDLELAKEFLANSSYDGTPVRIIVASGKLPRNDEVVQAIAAMLEEVGFAVDLQIMEGSAWVEKRGAGEYDMFISSMAFGRDTSSWAYNHLFKQTGHYEFNHAELLDLVKQEFTATSFEEQEAQLKAAFLITVEEVAPVCSWFCLDNRVGYQEKIANFMIRPDQTFNFMRVTKG